MHMWVRVILQNYLEIRLNNEIFIGYEVIFEIKIQQFIAVV